MQRPFKPKRKQLLRVFSLMRDGEYGHASDALRLFLEAEHHAASEYKLLAEDLMSYERQLVELQQLCEKHKYKKDAPADFQREHLQDRAHKIIETRQRLALRLEHVRKNLD